MITKIKNFWTSLDETTIISKRELFLGIVAAALAGLALGMIFSPITYFLVRRLVLRYRSKW